MRANYHTHTWRCNHAVGTEEEYVQAALDRGLEILGFSDHSPYIFPGDYYSGFRMRPEALAGYVETVLSLRERYRGRIEIPLGLELEYYPLHLPKLLPVLRDQPIDYVILGQHFVGNEIGDKYSGWLTGDDATLKRYCRQSMEAFQTGLFTCFAHPDLINFCGSLRFYEEQMRLLCREANDCGVPLELNLLGIREGRNYPNRNFWRIAGEEGCRVVLGVDAHDPGAIRNTLAEEKAMEMVREFDLKLMETVQLRGIR